MPALPPPIDFLPHSPEVRELPAPETQLPPKARRRPLLFAGAFLVCLAISLSYVWLREAVYEATASLLTVAPAAIDQPEAAANVQHVTVQEHTLLGVPLLEQTLRDLNAATGPEIAAGVTVDDLRNMLSVKAVTDTNVVELHARGPRAELLAPVVNAWIDAYQTVRERAVRESKDTTYFAVQEEFEKLGRQIEAKREELDRFRRAHDILSKTGTENQAMARLNGLNNALNKASDEEVQAKARLDAIEAAIARGDPVVPPREAQGLAQMQARAQQLREQVKDLRRRFTPQYVALQPQLKLIPEQLEQTEAAIRKMLEEGKRAALSEARQAYLSAGQSVREIRRQIEAHKHEAAEFTARFAEYEARVADLEQLEKLRRDTEARLAQIEAKPTEKYPQLQVVERAYPPTSPLWPDYWRDSGIAVAGSLAAALAFMLIYDFVTRREQGQPFIKLPDIRVYSVSENLLLRRQQDQGPALSQPEAAPALAETSTPALERPFPRELSEPELRQLLDAADLRGRQLLGLLLSGLSLAEAAALRAEDFDLAGNRLLVRGGSPRTLPLAPRLKAWLTQADPMPAWCSTDPPEPDELAAHIACVAADAGLPEPGTVDAEALRHTYILYLVRQGIRLAELERVVGKVPVKTAAAYARFSPPGPGLRADAVPLVHPTLRAENPVEAG
ncbi:GumC family protein [Candidatus Methylocalor cossyra]|uniref:Tyr recombinase domain-containing protein n=1 Tax=Candidatus Methylocalor cossyra TaxID=3108543 RepID=A0ABP1C934_9GAMM